MITNLILINIIKFVLSTQITIPKPIYDFSNQECESIFVSMIDKECLKFHETILKNIFTDFKIKEISLQRLLFPITIELMIHISTLINDEQLKNEYITFYTDYKNAHFISGNNKFIRVSYYIKSNFFSINEKSFSKMYPIKHIKKLCNKKSNDLRVLFYVASKITYDNLVRNNLSYKIFHYLYLYTDMIGVSNDNLRDHIKEKIGYQESFVEEVIRYDFFNTKDHIELFNRILQDDGTKIILFNIDFNMLVFHLFVKYKCFDLDSFENELRIAILNEFKNLLGVKRCLKFVNKNNYQYNFIAYFEKDEIGDLIRYFFVMKDMKFTEIDIESNVTAKLDSLIHLYNDLICAFLDDINYKYSYMLIKIFDKHFKLYNKTADCNTFNSEIEINKKHILRREPEEINYNFDDFQCMMRNSVRFNKNRIILEEE